MIFSVNYGTNLKQTIVKDAIKLVIEQPIIVHSVCEAYSGEIEGVLFRSYKDPFSKFKCKLQFFLSSEQYYQYLKCDTVLM